jgi:carboxypeptidase Q
VPPVDQPLFVRYTDEQLAEIAQYPVPGAAGGPNAEMQQRMRARMQRYRMIDQIAQFLADEKVAGVVVPSRDGARGGGSGGTIFDDNGAAIGRTPYIRGHEVKVPVVVMAIESYGRVYRLLEAHVPVQMEMDVETKFTGDHEHGFNTIAEIPGTDPDLKDQVVMVGGHLDSWIAGTGATDNGAGTVIAMETMRILNALGVHPRRTIRIALWSGEEEGLFGSRGYVRDHFGSAPLSTAPDQMMLPEFMRRAAGPIALKPEDKTLDVYFNIDYGHGKVRGIYLQDDAAAGPIFTQWIQPLKDLGVTTVSLRGVGSTDHVSFDAIGLPGFQFIQDQLDYESRAHHSNQDVFERLQPADLKQAAVVEATFVYNAAMRDQMIPRKPLPHPELREQENAPLKNLFPTAPTQ